MTTTQDLSGVITPDDYPALMEAVQKAQMPAGLFYTYGTCGDPTKPEPMIALNGIMTDKTVVSFCMDVATAKKFVAVFNAFLREHRPKHRWFK